MTFYGITTSLNIMHPVFSSLLPWILPWDYAYTFWASEPNLAYKYPCISQISCYNITNLLLADELQLSH